jgi:hypothetical protein
MAELTQLSVDQVYKGSTIFSFSFFEVGSHYVVQGWFWSWTEGWIYHLSLLSSWDCRIAPPYPASTIFWLHHPEHMDFQVSTAGMLGLFATSDQPISHKANFIIVSALNKGWGMQFSIVQSEIWMKYWWWLLLSGINVDSISDLSSSTPGSIQWAPPPPACV